MSLQHKLNNDRDRGQLVRPFGTGLGFYISEPLVSKELTLGRIKAEALKAGATDSAKFYTSTDRDQNPWTLVVIFQESKE
jgi:hypothetical protein